MNVENLSPYSSSPSCSFPFIFDGKSYSSCTKDGAIDEQLWCSTTPNYDKDGQWKRCSLQEYGGNSGGKPCIFPFIYKNRTFYTCTDEEKGVFWCATTRNYDKDLEWSCCADIRLDANPKGPCVFPFTYNSTSYSACTTDGISNKKPWCSLTSNYDTDLKWTYCEPSENPLCVFPFIYKGKSYSTCTSEGMSDGKLWCANTSNYDIDKKWVYCTVTEAAAEPKDLCAFPFMYNGKLYDSCTTHGMSQKKPWCSLTADYNADLQWTYCEPSGPGEVAESPPCIFPFIFKRQFYHSCTTDGRRDKKPWCATTGDYDTDKKRKLCPEEPGKRS
nr:epididymal sperm-binding protein 1-like [Zootoca vivipara]